MTMKLRVSLQLRLILAFLLLLATACTYQREKPGFNAFGAGFEIIEVKPNKTIVIKLKNGNTKEVKPEEVDFEFMTIGFFKPYCLECHGSSPIGNSLSFASYAGTVKLVPSKQPQSSRLYMSVKEGTMPKKPPTPKAPELEALAVWIEFGAKEKASGPGVEKSIPELKEKSFKGITDAVFEKHCNSCHRPGGDGADFTSYENLATLGWINLDDPKSSQIYQSVKLDRMPKPDGFADEEIKTGALKSLEAWIADGAREVVGGDKMGEGQITLPELKEKSFSGITDAVLSKYCNSCHSPQGSAKQLDFTNYEKLVSYNFIDIQNPRASQLHESVSSRRMPKGPTKESSGFQNSDVEKAVLKALELWIDDGARKVKNGPKAGEPEVELPVLKERSFKGITDAVLGTYCVTCHDGSKAGDMTSYKNLVSSGWININEPQKSALFESVNADRMPRPKGFKNENLKLAVLAALEEWLKDGAREVVGGPKAGEGQVVLPELKELSFKGITDAVFSQQCNTCHKPGGSSSRDFTDYKKLISYGMINIENPKRSQIYQSINAGRMPMPKGIQNPELKEAVLEAVELWISDGAREVVGGPKAGEGGVKLPELKEKSFRGITETVLAKYCNGCHREGGTSAMDFTDYKKLIALGVVNTRDPRRGSLYTSVEARRMPRPSGIKDKNLRNALLAAIEAWISDGAREVVGGPKAGEGEPKPPPNPPAKVTFRDIQRDVLNAESNPANAGVSCMECHTNGNSQKPPLNTYAEVLSLVVPGNAEDSLLFQSIKGVNGKSKMPKKWPGITPENQKKFERLVSDWIKAGAPE